MITNAALSDMSLTEREFEYLQRLLRMHYSHPFQYPLSGAVFEIVFARAIEGKRHKGKALFDVTRGRTGWSLKTIEKSFATLQRVEVIIKRSDVLKLSGLSLDSPADELGRAILKDFDDSFTASKEKQKVEDAQTAILVRDGHGRHCFFQQPLRPYGANEVEWRWTDNKEKAYKD